MSIAQVLYEQYKVLPVNVQEELLNLINDGRSFQKELSKKIEEIKNQPERPLKDILEDLDKELEKVMKEKGITQKDIDKASKELNRNRTEFKRKLRVKNESNY